MKRKSADPDASPKSADKSKPSAYAKALGLLARREHSRRELGQKLRRGGYAGDEADEALARLGEQRYQDDGRFAEVLIRNRIAQGYGPARLRAELKNHGLPDARIRALLEAAEADWDAAATAQLQRRFGPAGRAADPAERARRAQFLLRRGFSAATVRRVTHADVDDADADS
ncbi:regulatory protein RecX [Fulvimonas soli]|uniref:Regulatory protein RecX n=1 Tax=Fulvimonas soli TaxID=155197 RepID=A0A316IHY1_9GAMM|nr:regulatory protein RecX [Fulvimonas soli]PWK92769.1 regulatory protein [Fulvimonas soli]TNY28047.1 recombination regulator RecX [Fulvimonas soli]